MGTERRRRPLYLSVLAIGALTAIKPSAAGRRSPRVPTPDCLRDAEAVACRCASGDSMTRVRVMAREWRTRGRQWWAIYWRRRDRKNAERAFLPRSKTLPAVSVSHYRLTLYRRFAGASCGLNREPHRCPICLPQRQATPDLAATCRPTRTSNSPIRNRRQLDVKRTKRTK
jgi:hypothetical protein